MKYRDRRAAYCRDVFVRAERGIKIKYSGETNMDINIRKATKADLAAIEGIYDRILTEEERGRAKIGWVRGVYPTRATAEAALEADELFVEEADGRVVGVAIINGKQVDAYAGAPWMYDVPDSRITVLHTLVIDPLAAGRGLGTAFVSFYERYAAERGCPYLRMDTNQKNTAARALYKKLGYREVDIRPCGFNGISGVNLVLLEKKADMA